MPSMSEFNDMLHQLYQELALAHSDLSGRADDHVRAEHLYRMTKARAFIAAEGSVEARKAAADVACDAVRLDARLKEAIKNSALERLRDLRAQMSALQTLAHNSRVETEVLRLPEPREPTTVIHMSDYRPEAPAYIPWGGEDDPW